MVQTRTAAPGATKCDRSPVDGEIAIDDCADGNVMSPAALAQGICLRLLTTRPRSRVELAGALHQRGIPEEVAESVLDRLGELGLINDAALAEAAVYSGFSHRGLGRRALSTELRRRGVPDEVVCEAVATVQLEDEEQRARELVRRRLRTIPVRATSNLARKLGAMLVRKGYPEGLAWRVVRDELGPGDWGDEIESCPD
jgi:regulatory protein